MKLMVVLMGLLVGLLALASVATSAVQSGAVEYKSGQAVLEGYTSQDTGVSGKRPAVLVVPDWMGVSQSYKDIADKLASMGYVAFVADIYGKGVRPSNREEASKEAGKYKADRKLMRERVTAALDELRKNPNVDPERIAAIGYCFGGTTVLELGRSGADIAGIVSFHGGLDSPTPADGKNIKGKVLVLHGADDPLVPLKDILAFKDELRNAGVDWQMVYYGDAVHSFTQQRAGSDKSKGNAYHEKADKRSWEAMKQFFTEIFGETTNK